MLIDILVWRSISGTWSELIWAPELVGAVSHSKSLYFISHRFSLILPAHPIDLRPMSTARYSPVVDDGLEVVPGTAPEHRPVEHSADNPPEVQERDDYPEAIPEQTDLKQDQNKGEGFFAPGVHDPSPPYSNSQYVRGWSDPQAQKARRRVCGLPFWGFIALAVAVIVIVILAAVLGGVLGSKKSNSNTIINDGNNGGSSNSSSSGDTTKPYPAQAGSGISAVQLGGDGNQPITYVQDESNNIIENIWIPSNDSANTFSSSTKSTVATDAKKGSPIVAMSYLRNATSLVTVSGQHP